MPDERKRGFFRSRRRAVNLLLQPSLQLRLPLYLILMTFGFSVFWMGHGLFVFERLFDGALETSSDRHGLLRLLEYQTRDFLIWSGVIGTAYSLAVFALCVVSFHKLVGPTVAFRRQLEALKNGDYSRRVQLRKGDAFVDLADDLNELAEILEQSEKSTGPS